MFMHIHVGLCDVIQSKMIAPITFNYLLYEICDLVIFHQSLILFASDCMV